MDRERARELLPIIEAFAEGKTIQAKGRRIPDWLDIDGERDDIDFGDDFEFRIKREPREGWITIDSLADHYPLKGKKWIKVREVLDED